MIQRESKNHVRQRVHERIRNRIAGTSQRPRLNVYRSLNHIYAQLIDDASGATLVSASSIEGGGAGAKGKANGEAKKGHAEGGEAQAAGAKSQGEGKKSKRTGGNLAAAKDVGKKLAERAREKGVQRVVFDRGGYLYHGRVKALAEAARAAGLQF